MINYSMLQRFDQTKRSVFAAILLQKNICGQSPHIDWMHALVNMLQQCSGFAHMACIRCMCDAIAVTVQLICIFPHTLRPMLRHMSRTCILRLYYHKGELPFNSIVAACCLQNVYSCMFVCPLWLSTRGAHFMVTA